MAGQPGNLLSRACLGSIYKLLFAFALVVVAPLLEAVAPSLAVSVDPASPAVLVGLGLLTWVFPSLPRLPPVLASGALLLVRFALSARALSSLFRLLP